MDQTPDLPPGGPDWLKQQLFERRIVFLRGSLDDDLVGRTAAELMTLDATGDDPVQLHIDSPGGSLQAAFALMDTIEALGVPVYASCVGRAEGSAVGVFAAAERRLMSPHARIRLAEPRESASGNAAELASFAGHYQAQLMRFVTVLARCTGRPAEHIEADLAAGRWLSAEEAVGYGIAHEIWVPRRDRPPASRPPFGFRPPSIREDPRAT